VTGQQGKELSCKAGNVFARSPQPYTYLQPIAIVDASLHFLITQTQVFRTNHTSQELTESSLTIQELAWVFDATQNIWQATPIGIQNIFENSISENINAETRGDLLAAVKTSPDPSGVLISVGKQIWPLTSSTPKPLPQFNHRMSGGWVELKSSIEGKCNDLFGRVTSESSSQTSGGTTEYVSGTVYESDGYCFFVSRSGPGTVNKDGEQLSVQVYVKPEGEMPGFPLSVAFLSFGEQALEDRRWFVNNARGDPNEGWIALQINSKSEHPSFQGLPWSTEALMKMGQTLLDAGSSVFKWQNSVGNSLTAELSVVPMDVQR
jgi:hypothetical protein